MGGNYPPLQEAPIDPRTGRFTKAWSLYFQNLLTTTGDNAIHTTSDLTLQGREGGTGKPLDITVGDGLRVVGTTLQAWLGLGLYFDAGRITAAVQAVTASYYEPLTNGNEPLPDLIFSDGDCISVLKVV